MPVSYIDITALQMEFNRIRSIDFFDKNLIKQDGNVNMYAMRKKLIVKF